MARLKDYIRSVKKRLVDPFVVWMMRRDWDERAKTNARHFIATGQEEWSDEAFFQSGKASLGEVLVDLQDICRGRKPSEMRVLEIGCGAGRMSQSLSEIFGSVDAVDISNEMIVRARSALIGYRNIRFHVNNGVDLSMLSDHSIDFAFSYIVFQHIPRKRIIENYVRETWRVLRPNSLFRFQVQGGLVSEQDANTWLGVGFTEAEIATLATSCGFKVQNSYGAGTQFFWVTLLKP